MKKLNLFLSFLILTVFSTSAQDDNENSKTVTFGAKAGYTTIILKVKVDSESDSDDISGFYIGTFANIPLSQKLDLQPELLYSTYSEDGENTGVLQLPILLKYNVDDRFGLVVGPQLDFLTDDDDAAGIKRVGVGIAGGIAFDITDELFMDARYSFGLYDRLSSGLPGFEEFDVKTYFNYLHIGLGYRF